MMNSIKYIFSIILVFIVAANGFGQEIMTLEECRQQAIEHNKELKKANLQIQEATSQKKVAKTSYLPSLSADVNAMYLMNLDDVEVPGSFFPTADQSGNITGLSDVYMPGISMEMDNLSIVYGGLSVAQPIYTGGKINAANQMAKTGLEMTEMAHDLKYAEVVELTDKAFWNVAMVEANIKLAEKYIEMLTELEEQMASMHKVGLQPASEKLKVSVQKNQAELQLMRAQNGLKLAKMNLNQVLGHELDANLKISYDTTANMQLMDLSNGAELAMTNRKELRILEKQVELSEYNKKMDRADYLPQVGLGFQYTGSWVEEYREDVSFNPAIAAQITIPIFSWGQGYHKQKVAHYKVKQAEMELSRTNDLLNLEVLQVQVQIEEAYESILIAEKNIQEAETSLDETKSSFDVGLNTTSELLMAQAEWMNAKVQQIQALANYRILETTWDRVTGRLDLVK